MGPEVSVLVSAYNQASELERVLTGFCRQTHPRFELIVADDGSGPEVKAVVDAFARRAPFSIGHVYQPDEGFRKSRIMNTAARESRSGYLIFSDGDCVPHRAFVQAHVEHRAPNTVLCGRRVLLGKELSSRLTPEMVSAGWPERMSMDKVVAALLARGSHWEEAILLRSPFVRRQLLRNEPCVLGSNFSMEKSLFDVVNGYDEAFVHYNGEETDLEARLRQAGARFRWVTHLAIQYHLLGVSRQSTAS